MDDNWQDGLLAAPIKTRLKPGVDRRGFKPDAMRFLVRRQPQSSVIHPAVVQLEFPDDDHNQTVRRLLLNGGLTLATLHFEPVYNRLRATPNTAEEYLVYNIADSINEVSDKLEMLLQAPNRTARVVNISYSTSALHNYLGFFDRYNQDDAFQAQVRQALSLAEDATDEAQTQAIFSYIDATIATHPEILAAQERYRQVTETAAAQGLIIIVAAGNGQDKIDGSRAAGYRLVEPGAYNFLAMSRFVISVAAVEAGSVTDWDSHRTVPFSARGTHVFYPLIAANGCDILDIAGLEGSSYAAPQVTAAVARMLQQNPALTFSELVTILQRTAIVNSDLDPLQNGLGLLNAEKALQAARPDISSIVADLSEARI